MSIKEKSEEAMFKKAEFIANKIIELFEDVYPKDEYEREHLGKVEGVICYIIGSDGFFRLNSEVMEVNKLSIILYQDFERMSAYANVSRLTGMKDFRSK